MANNGVSGWRAFILKRVMKIGWFLIKTFEFCGKIITKIFNKIFEKLK